MTRPDPAAADGAAFALLLDRARWRREAKARFAEMFDERGNLAVQDLQKVNAAARKAEKLSAVCEDLATVIALYSGADAAAILAAAHAKAAAA